jgi:hypothetical protein
MKETSVSYRIGFSGSIHTGIAPRGNGEYGRFAQ